jgi:hypothetical protein
MIYYLFDNILIFRNGNKNVQLWSSPAGSIISWPLGSGSVIHDHGTADPEEIFKDPQQCRTERKILLFNFLNFNIGIITTCAVQYFFKYTGTRFKCVVRAGFFSFSSPSMTRLRSPSRRQSINLTQEFYEVSAEQEAREYCTWCWSSGGR